MAGTWTFHCSFKDCGKPVSYQDDDPLQHTTGAMLRREESTTPRVVYLTCEEGHTRRYELRAGAGDG